jgi:hypothetical protein
VLPALAQHQSGFGFEFTAFGGGGDRQRCAARAQPGGAATTARVTAAVRAWIAAPP